MKRSIGYECQVPGSATKDVAAFTQRAQATLARDRAEKKALQEIADAEKGNALWDKLQAVRHKFLEALESVTQPSDGQQAQAICASILTSSQQDCEARVRAALEPTRAAILAKASYETACPRCGGTGEDPTSTRDDLGLIVTLVVCKQCRGSKVYRHPLFGKTIKFQGQPTITVMTRDDGLQTVRATWDYEVV